MKAVVALMVAVTLFGSVVWLNVAYVCHRRRLTPAERRAEDERLEMWIW